MILWLKSLQKKFARSLKLNLNVLLNLNKSKDSIIEWSSLLFMLFTSYLLYASKLKVLLLYLNKLKVLFFNF